jgi:hypothetical protein
VAFGDAAFKEQPLPYLLLHAKTEQVAREILITLVVDGPSHFAY